MFFNNTQSQRILLKKFLSDDQIDILYNRQRAGSPLEPWLYKLLSKREAQWSHNGDKYEMKIPRFITDLNLNKKTDYVIDFGAGDGSLANAMIVAGYERVLCVDVDNYLQNIDLPFMKRTINKPLNIESNSVSLVIARVSLHHVIDLIFALGDIVRILKPNGYLFIKEHDVYSKNVRFNCLAEHYLYELSEHKDVPQNLIYAYNILTKIKHHNNPSNVPFLNFMSKKVLTKIFTDIGMIEIKQHIVGRSPTGIYYQLLQKK